MKDLCWVWRPRHLLLISCSGAPLQADDRRFKEELGRVVEMDIWDAAKAVSAEQLRGVRSDMIRLESESDVRTELLATLCSQVLPAPTA